MFPRCFLTRIMYALVSPIPTQGCTYPGCKVTQVTTFCLVVTSICGSWEWNLLHVTHLAPKTLWWLLHFWKTCEPLANQLNLTTVTIIGDQCTSQSFSFQNITKCSLYSS
jgi:hypothetical protein